MVFDTESSKSIVLIFNLNNHCYFLIDGIKYYISILEKH